MTDAWKVLVLPGGTEIGLEIHAALSERRDVELFSAGMDVSSHAPYAFARHETHPGISAPNSVQVLNAIIQKHQIDFVYPAHDDAVLSLARVRSEIAARVLCSPLDTCEIARSKRATYRALEGYVAVPRLYEHPEDIRSFPVFVKPDRGQGSQGARLVRSRSELDAILHEEPGLVVLEYLPGPEYTVDCFSDRERGLLFCAGRQRDRIRNGISMATHHVADPRIRPIAEAICKPLTFHGAWFFQVKADASGNLRILEVAPRIAGAMALDRVAGVNFPLLTIYEELRRPYDIRVCNYEARLDRALVNRYDTNLSIRNVYVDLDDTLIVRGRVSLPVVRFLYQCINSGARIVLLSRHAGDLDATLRRHRLQCLFDRIVHLRSGEPKSLAIDNRNDAILLDDSYAERCEVERNAGIPVFDNSMIEALQDYRT